MSTDQEREAFGLVVERKPDECPRRTTSEPLFSASWKPPASRPSPSRPPKGTLGSVTLVGWTCTSTTRASSSRPTACGTGSRSPSTVGPAWTGISRTCSRPAPASETASSPTASTTSSVEWAKKSCPCCRTERCGRSTAQNRQPRLREYLHSIISAPAENIIPNAETLERHFGSDSDAFHAGNLLLHEAYQEHRDNPTVAVKRRLWQDLLQVALGKDAAAAGDESDWLFIRHTYITSPDRRHHATTTYRRRNPPRC